MSKISDFVNVTAGIVTGANNYFIQTQDVINKYELDEFTLPIIKKGSYTNYRIEFTSNSFNTLAKENKARFLISIKENSCLNKRNIDYIKIGEEQYLNIRYKCSLRNRWYCVPNISTPPEAFFLSDVMLIRNL